MHKNVRLILAILFVGAITISGLVLMRKGVGGSRIDLTEDNLYTLSEGTENILSKLNEPITLKLYYSRTAAMKGPDQIRFWNNYYLYVRDLLEEYASLSDGKVKLELVDPRTYSLEEEEAVRNGIRRFPLDDDKNFYFGLLASTEKGKDEIIPFFEPNRQELVEYDVSKMITSLVQRKKSKIGIISSLPVTGSGNMSPYMIQMMRMQGRQPDPPWAIVQQLRADYEVQSLTPEAHEVPADIDFLMVIHPKNLGQKAMFAIDQFVMRGGKLMVFVDPHCIADRPQRDPRNPMAAMNHKAGSQLNNLLVNWGAVVYTKKIAVDRTLATKTGRPPQAFIPYLSLTDNCVNKEHRIVQDIKGLRMLFAGAIGRHGGTAEFTPLVSTTNTGNTWTPSDPMMLNAPDPQKIQKEVVDGKEAVTLACLLTGNMRSIFPNGIDIPDDSPPPASQPATTQPAERTKHLDAIKSTDKGTVLVVSDVDIITDMLCYDRSFFGMSQSGGNIPFILNALEYLSGSEDLISIRSRGRFLRPFTLIDEIERESDRQTQTQVDEVNAEIKRHQEGLNALVAKGQDASVLEAAALAKKRQIEASITACNRKLRDLRGVRRDKVEAIESGLEAFNKFLASAIMLLVAIILWLVRYFQAKHYAAQRT